MKFEETQFSGVTMIELEPHVDSRGFFERFFCGRELRSAGITFNVAQCNLTVSRKGALRGMHYEYPPVSEQKIVRCFQGTVYYVLLDMRVGSPTYLQHVGFHLDSCERKMLYVPPGFASGSQAVSDGAEVGYIMSVAYSAGREGGFRYDDPVFRIPWPLAVSALSEKDARWPGFAHTAIHAAPEAARYGNTAQ
jgi:dTDP-4-dehydrorhamnose 3,5-epimerase